ncbi:MAG: Uma2 family endonuclease [Acidobacteria bacterium]|nr:Uma2 family endonuclease [Acidobacteriota bacterium]
MVYLPLQVYHKSLGDLPPLEQGDHLSGDEFERRYEAMPGLKKAELINGRVYMSSPVRFDRHSEQHSWITTWLCLYSVATPSVRSGDNATVRMDEEEYPQPDVTLIIDAPLGSSYIGADGYLRGAPELVAEVAASSASYDLNEKKETYRRHGAQEYIVWQVYDRRIDWFRLEAGQYIPLSPDEDGVIRSRVFPGLWLDVEALLKDDMAKVLAILQQGLASVEHIKFVEQLSSTKS